MRKSLIVVFAVAALVVAMTVPASGVPSPFHGTWTSIDIDGSSQELKIGGSSHPHMKLVDDGATVCSTAVPPDIAAVAKGWGSIAGDTLTVSLDTKCLTRPPTVAPGSPFTVNYVLKANGTLVDDFGVVWTKS